MDPTNIDALIGKGHCYLSYGDHNEARSIWEKTHRIAPITGSNRGIGF